MKANEITEIPLIPRRSPESHKGNFGKVLIISGSRGMSGAAYLCGKAALRSGSGLVTLAGPKSLNLIYAVGLPSALTLPLPETEEGALSIKAGDEILANLLDCDAAALGPGISRHPETEELVHYLLPRIRQPLVLDADGINALEKKGDLLLKRKAPIILTPHPREMSRLTGVPLARIQQDRTGTAMRWAKKLNAIVLLKGHNTVVSDGTSFYINRTGNPGMATGGSGDVLTGIVVSLLGQEIPAFQAAMLGAFVHGLAGDLEKAEKGEISLIASDLLGALPRAFRHCQSGPSQSQKLQPPGAQKA